MKYATIEEADRAIRALHDRYTFPGVSLISGSHKISSFSSKERHSVHSDS